MPKYSLRLGNSKVTLAETDESIGSKIGRTLEQSSPQTFVDGGGNIDNSRFQAQEHSRDQLLEYRHIRESGGPVAALIEAKALLTFGTATEWDTENADLTEWLDNKFSRRDLLFIDIGMDGYTYPGVPCEIVETRGGDFSHVEFIEPWTVVPKTDNKGEIQYFEQHVKINGQLRKERIEKEDLAYFVLNKSNGRDKTGISEIERNRKEIERFYDNQESIKNSSQLHGFPQRHIKVGREGQAPPSDNELRRLRSRFSKKWNELTMFVTGQDVDMDTLEATDFDFSGITENDMKILTLSFLLPQELGNVGSDGLGSGMPADLRRRLLEIEINAKQRMLATQFVESVAKPVVEQYSPYDPEDLNGIEWEPLEDDIDDRVNRAKELEDYLTTNEMREAGNYEPEEDDEIGESYDTPGEDSSDDDLGGLFNKNADGGSYYSESGDRLNSALEDGGRTSVKFQNVGGDPFTSQDALESFLDDLDELADGPVFIGETTWPSDDYAMHDRPVKAVGLSKTDAQRVYDEYEDSVMAIGGPTEATDIEDLFFSDGDSGNLNLTVDEFDGLMMDQWDKVVDTDDTDRQLLGFTEGQMPQFVKDRIRDAILSGATFTDFETIPSSELMNLREHMLESLQSDGWTIDGVADQLMSVQGVDSRDRAETIARTETAATLNSAREIGYEEMGQDGDKFYWTGATPGDDRQTGACEWLIERTNPHHGGTPVELSELKDLIAEAPRHDDEMQDDLARPGSFVVHPNERSTWVRHVEGP